MKTTMRYARAKKSLKQRYKSILADDDEAQNVSDESEKTDDNTNTEAEEDENE